MNITYRKELYKVIQGISGDAAEIGVAEGRFSEEILNWPVQFAKVYLVDRWRCVPTQKGDASNHEKWHQRNLEDCHKRVDRFKERVMFLQGESIEMAKKVPDRSLALVYIDGDHSFAGCSKDIQAWLPKVAPDGVMAFHDYENPAYGVKPAVQLLLRARGSGVLHLIPEDHKSQAGCWLRIRQ